MSTPAQEDTGATIVKTEGVLGGKARLEGHRISVLDVTELLDVGYSVEETAQQLSITTDEVRAASRYFRHHREEITGAWLRRQDAHEEPRRSG